MGVRRRSRCPLAAGRIENRECLVIAKYLTGVEGRSDLGVSCQSDLRRRWPCSWPCTDTGKWPAPIPCSAGKARILLFVLHSRLLEKVSRSARRSEAIEAYPQSATSSVLWRKENWQVVPIISLRATLSSTLTRTAEYEKAEMSSAPSEQPRTNLGSDADRIDRNSTHHRSCAKVRLPVLTPIGPRGSL